MNKLQIIGGYCDVRGSGQARCQEGRMPVMDGDGEVRSQTFFSSDDTSIRT